MKYFELIRSGIDTAPLLDEIRAQDDAWSVDKSRQTKIRVQRDTNTIFICGPAWRPDLPVNENQESRVTSMAHSFPKALSFMKSIASERGASLSRATIVRLKPQSKVLPHVDVGSYYLIRNRYHLVLQSSAGSVMLSGDEEVRMREGELWWFDNKQYHEAYNESTDWRIHYIFDLLPDHHKSLARNPPVPKGMDIQNQKSARAIVAKPSDREIILYAIRNHAILRGDKQVLISPKGTPNSWLIDLRRIFMDGGTLSIAADLFLELCADLRPYQVGAIEAAAIPLLAAILTKSALQGNPLNGFIIRKERRTYGAGTLIEGTITMDPIILLDDLFNSGSSLEKARVVLEHEGRTISVVFVFVDFHSDKGETWRMRHGITVRSVFSLSDLDLEIKRKAPPPVEATFSNIWRRSSPDANFFHRVPKSFPAVYDNRIYFGSDAGMLWCLDAHKGSPIWTYRVKSRGHKNIWSSPVIHNGRVFFGAYDGNVYCLNSDNGEEVWRFIGAEWVGSSPALATDLGLLFVGLEFAIDGKMGSIVALDIQTGEKVWEYLTKKYTHASPAYCAERQLVACGSNNNEMLLFEARTGMLRWRFETGGSKGTNGSIRHAPAFDVKRNHLITGCSDGAIYIIDVETGKLVWSVQTDNTIYTVPLVVDDTAYVGSTDKYFYILDLERKSVTTKIYAGSKIFGPATLVDGRIYFGACNGLVYEVDPQTFSTTGTHQLPDAVTNAVAYNQDSRLFYALTYMNELYAFRRVSCREASNEAYSDDAKCTAGFLSSCSIE